MTRTALATPAVLPIVFPRTLDEEGVSGFWTALATNRALGRVAIETIVTDGEASYQVRAEHPAAISALLRAHLPTVVTLAALPPEAEPASAVSFDVKLHGSTLGPLAVYQPVATTRQL